MFKFFGRILVAIMVFIGFSVDCGGNLKGEGEHYFYLYDNSSLAKTVKLDEAAASVFFYFKNQLKGESVIFNSAEKANALIEEFCATLVLCESGNDFYCEYFYTPKIKNFVQIDGKKVNLHFSYSNDRIKVGTPLIFDSF